MKNKKRLLSVLTLFMCIALVSIGFAAWVITGDARESKQGNVNVTDVSDERLQITEVQLSEPSIVFGKNAASPANHWLKAPDVGNEVLSTTLTFNVVNNAQCIGVDIALAPAAESKDAYDAALLAKVIVAPTNVSTTLEKVEGEPGAYSITFTWAWGTEFSLDGSTAGTNPFEFYNTYLGDGYDIADTRSAEHTGNTNADYAKKALNALYGLQGVKFDISIHAKSTASQA